jgi:hypothetical protein
VEGRVTAVKLLGEFGSASWKQLDDVVEIDPPRTRGKSDLAAVYEISIGKAP